MSQLFASGGQSIGASASALPVSVRIVLFDLLSVQGTFKSLLQNHSLKTQFFGTQPSLWFQLSHLYMTAGKPITLTIQTFVDKVMSLLFNMLSRVVIAFLPGNVRPKFPRLQFSLETLKNPLLFGAQ